MADAPVAIANEIVPVGNGAAPLAPAEAWDRFLHLPLNVTVDIPVAGLTVRELFRLEKGSVVSTAHPSGANVPLRVGGSQVGWGEIQVVGGDQLAFRLAELS